MPGIWYPSTPVTDGALGITVDGGGATIDTGNMGYVLVPYTCTIKKWKLYADRSGSVVVDIWKSSGSFLPSITDSIVGATPPTLLASQSDESTDLSDWDTAIHSGDTIGFTVSSVSGIYRINLILEVSKR